MKPERESFAVDSDRGEKGTSAKHGSLPRDTFSRAWTENVFGRMTRTFTEGFGLKVGAGNDTEDAWTKRLYETYQIMEKKGVEGDIPAPQGFTGEAAFWKVFFLAACFGVLLGLVGIAFLLCAEKVPKLWVSNSSFSSFEDVDFYAGKQYYIFITGGTGLIVGICRYMTNYPETLKGVFKEIEEYHVDPTFAPHTIVISAMSLAGGACLGPEQALGNIGGGLATWLVENHIEFPDETDRQMVVLCAMCAAFGALFPTPVLAVLLIYELGQPPKPFMESIVLLAVGATGAFIMYYQFAENFLLDKLSSNGIVLAALWTFNNEQCAYALGFGVVSGGICLCAVIMIGVCRQVFNRLRDRLDNNTRLSGTIVAPLVGGIIVGCISWVLPLTIGDGNLAFKAIVQLTFEQVEYYNGALTTQEGQMTAHLLICSMFAKMFTTAVSLNCGFVGGFVFPLITVGCMAGSAAALIYTEQPTGLCISCFMAAVPAGICPMPFTLMGIAIYCFYFGLYQTVPVFIAVITSYTVVCGTGIFRKLADRGDAMAKQRREEQTARRKQLRDSLKGGGPRAGGSEGSATSNPLNKSAQGGGNSGDLDPNTYLSSAYGKSNRPIAPRADGLVNDV